MRTLQTIDEDTILDPDVTTDSGTFPLSRWPINMYGEPSSDGTSVFSYSTNSTASNLVGPGRVLGNLYSVTGRRLENALGGIAHRAGFGPEAIYERISTLYLEDWKKDGKKASVMMKLCLKLFEHTTSVVESTRFKAITKWGDILRDHYEIYAWLFCGQRAQTITHTNALRRAIEAVRSTNDSIIESQIDVLNRTTLLLDCHYVGLEFLSLSRGELYESEGGFQVEWKNTLDFSTKEVDKLGILFEYLTESLLSSNTSRISQWYFQMWSSQDESKQMHAQLALLYCRHLEGVLKSGNLPTADFGIKVALQGVCKKIHEYLTGLLDFTSPLKLTESNKCEIHDSVIIHLPTAIATLNGLVRACNSVVPESSLLPLPGCLKEKIKPLLNAIENGPEKRESETILLRIFNRLFDHALFEIMDGTCSVELFNCTSFDDETGRSSALLQLGDILQSHPVIYELMVTLGEDEARHRVQEIWLLLDIAPSKSTSESINGAITNLLSILKCHTLGCEFHQFLLPVLERTHLDEESTQVECNDSLNYPNEEIEKWGVTFQYLLESLLNPRVSKISQWYIGFWSSQLIEGTPHVHTALQCCRSLQNVLGAVEHPKTTHCDALQELCSDVYVYLVRGVDTDTLLPVERAHVSSTLNDLVQSHDRVFSPTLEVAPNLACLTMLGSTEFISVDDKKAIQGVLNLLESGYGSREPEVCFATKMFLRSCNKLLACALSELGDTNFLDKFSNATSSTEGTGRFALLQLGDILQTLPEVYILLIILGGDETRARMLTLCKFFRTSKPFKSTSELYPKILRRFHSLLSCHTTGSGILYRYLQNAWHYKINAFISETQPYYIFEFLLEHHMREFLMDNVTYNPSMFYLKYWMSSSRLANYGIYWRLSLISCAVVQDTLCAKEGVPQETRDAMEELCRTMQILIIEHLTSARRPITRENVDAASDAIGSAYRYLTKSKSMSEDVAESYLLHLFNLLFDAVLKVEDRSDICWSLYTIHNFFINRDIFGWFLSIRGPDAEERITKLREAIDNVHLYRTEDRLNLEWNLSCVIVHRLGVNLLAPRHERLHFENYGLTKHPSTGTRSSEPPLTAEQRKRWENAFKTLTGNLMYSRGFDLRNISLFYFANCPLPYEADPMLSTTVALVHCGNLQSVISRINPWERDKFSRAVSHIHTCLTRRVEYVQRSCRDLGPDAIPTFDNTPFDIPKVVNVLNDLAKSSKEKLGAYAPELLSVPDRPDEKAAYNDRHCRLQ